MFDNWVLLSLDNDFVLKGLISIRIQYRIENSEHSAR